MKKLFSLLTLALLTMSAWAQTSTLTFTAACGGTGTADDGAVWTVTSDAAESNFDSNRGIHYGTNSKAVSYLTLTTSDIKGVITSIIVNAAGASGNAVVNVTVGGNAFGEQVSITSSAANYTFNGNAEGEIIVTISQPSTAKALYCKSITVVYGNGELPVTVAAPTLPATQFFDNEFEVEITNIDEGATAKYSTDGLTWQNYTAPFTITETTTVYAKSVKGEIESEVVSAKYIKDTPVTGTCITFNYADDTSFTTAKEYTVERVGASFTVSNGLIDGHYRIYKDQTIAFTSTAGNIIRIEFDCTANAGAEKYGPDHLTVNDNNGDYNYAGKLGIWTGSAENVTFTASTAQVRATEIRVYVDGELPTDFVAAPTFNPASQEFEEAIDVNLTAEDGATIYYNYDNSDNWNVYSAALHITETTTVYAKAVKGEKESTVVSATYTKNEPVEAIMTLAEVNALVGENGGNVDFTFGGNAVVTAQQGGYLWLRDATGYGLIYGKINGVENLTFSNGQVLNPNWNATKTVYNGLTEYKNATNVSASVNTDAELAAPQEITELSAELINAYVVVKNITSFTVSGRNITAHLSNGSTMVMYNQFNTVITDIPTEEGNYTVTGAVSRFAKGETDQIQLYILKIDGFVPEVTSVDNIAAANALDKDTHFKYNGEATVTYQWTNPKNQNVSTWIKDATGSGLIYGKQVPELTQGTVLVDGWEATFTYFNSIPEYTNPSNIVASEDVVTVTPKEYATIDTTNVNEYVILKGLSITAQEGDTTGLYFVTADGLVIYNQFGVELPTFEEGKTYDVIGIATIYKHNAELYVISATEVEAPAGLRGDVNLDQQVNIQDVTALINYILSKKADGISLENANCNEDDQINIQDVTTLINYILSKHW
jgi:hypothetical protein